MLVSHSQGSSFGKQWHRGKEEQVGGTCWVLLGLQTRRERMATQGGEVRELKPWPPSSEKAQVLRQ